MALLFPHPWIKFEDIDGPGWAEPDFIVVGKECVWLCECKLSQRDVEDQVMGLYHPLVSAVFRKPVVPVQFCKIVKNTGTCTLVNDLVEAKTVDELHLIHVPF